MKNIRINYGKALKAEVRINGEYPASIALMKRNRWQPRKTIG